MTNQQTDNPLLEKAKEYAKSKMNKADELQPVNLEIWDKIRPHMIEVITHAYLAGASNGLKNKEIPRWTEPDENGIIHIPDELDELVNKIGIQIRFHTISGKGEVETVCEIAYIAQKYFTPSSPIQTIEEKGDKES